jgi:hypothetical protein
MSIHGSFLEGQPAVELLAQGVSVDVGVILRRSRALHGMLNLF